MRTRLFWTLGFAVAVAACGGGSSPSTPSSASIGIVILATSGDGSFTYTFQNATYAIQTNQLAPQTFNVIPGTYQLTAQLPPGVSIIRFDFGHSDAGGVASGSIIGTGSGSSPNATVAVAGQCFVYFSRVNAPTVNTTTATGSATFTVSTNAGC